MTAAGASGGTAGAAKTSPGANTEDARRGVAVVAGDGLDVVEGLNYIGRVGEGVGVAVGCAFGVGEVVSSRNGPNSSGFGAERSVSRRPITVAVFRRAVRRHRAPARRSTPSPTPTRCPTLAESVSAEKRRVVSAAIYGRVRASVEVCAACLSVDGPDRRRGRLDRGRERPGAPPGAQNSSFSPKFAPLRPLASYHGASRVTRWSSVSRRRATKVVGRQNYSGESHRSGFRPKWAVFGPWGRPKALSAAIQRPAAAVGTLDGREDRRALGQGPDAAAQGRGNHPLVLGRDAFGECRAPCGRRRRCRSPCRSSMMSNRPAEHSGGDRSTRNAAFGAEIIRFRAIRGHLGPERPLPRQFRNSGRL